jgi:vitamin B12 transporter
MTSRIIIRAAGLIACSVPLWAHAQAAAPVAPVANLSDIVVTASRMPQEAKDALGDVTVINNATLTKSGQSSLAEVLSREPGIEYSNNGGPQQASSLFIRGANADQTLVLVDGIRINSSVTGGTFFETFDPGMLDHVEILRGAASSLYGADAIGGVVNIITHPTDQGDRPLSISASTGYGSYDTSRTRLGLSGAANGWDYSLAAGYSQSGGFNATTPANFSYNPDRDGYYQNTVLGSVGYRWAPGHRIGLTAYSAYLNGQYDNGANPVTGAFFNDRAITRQQVYALSSTDDITSFWQSVLRVGYSRDDQKNLNAPSDFSPTGISRFGSDKTTYTWQNNFKLTEAQNLSVVLERLEEHVIGNTVYDQDNRSTNSVGLIYRADFGAHHLQVNARNDNITSYGSETTGGIAYGYDLTPDWRIGAAANTGFKAPSFQDLFYPGYSNPNLSPERSRNTEASLRYTTDDTKLGLVIYRNKVRDLIISTAANDFIPYNVDHATLEGITLSGEQHFGATTLRASADFQNPKDDETGKQLALRAKDIFRAGVDHRFGAFLLGSEVMVSGRRFSDAANQNHLGGYTLFNLLASYDINRNLQAQVRWNNVLDKNYRLVDGYETPGSNVFVNLTWRM